MLSFFRNLVQLGFEKPEDCEYWIDEESLHELFNEQHYWHHFLFIAPKTYLDMLLWISFVNDFPAIQSSPGCWVYLIDINKETIIMPYDDRGMDVVGNNHEFLKELYHKFNHYLLDSDREIMDKPFHNK